MVILNIGNKAINDKIQKNEAKWNIGKCNWERWNEVNKDKGNAVEWARNIGGLLWTIRRLY